ncbi:MAG: 4Fe-4S binding protein, partial [Raoultibacter sp.]
MAENKTIETEAKPSGIQRRDFLKGAAFGAMGMLPMAALFGCSPQRSEAVDSAGASASETTGAATKADGEVMTLAEMNAFRKELIDSKSDYTCSDGVVIPAVYVKLRALIDTYGNGVGSELTDASFSEVMYHFSEEDAQAYLEMPMGTYFTAVDYSVESGRSEAECLAILEDLSSRGLLMRVRRGGVPYFHQLAEAHGIWEYCLLKESTAEYTTIHSSQWGSDIIQQLYNADTPFYYAIPVNKEVVADEEILPYDDYEKIIARNSVFAVSNCQCRLSHETIGTKDAGNHPLETCLTTGEQAEFYIENGIGREIDREEALAILKRSVEAGMVLQSAWTKDTEVICSCHGDCCDILMSYVALGDDYASLNSSMNVSHYSLKYDKDSCQKCGSCADRCPLSAITIGEDGF